LAAHQERVEVVQLTLQRQARYRSGWLKLSAWEHPFDDEETARHQAEVQQLQHNIAELGTRLADRDAARQRSVRNGLLRAAPRTIKALAEHGQVPFPAYAYLPPSAKAAASGKATVVALEDGFPLRTVLTTDELCAAMQDVQKWETAAGN
jgi:hypothetical protein